MDEAASVQHASPPDTSESRMTDNRLNVVKSFFQFYFEGRVDDAVELLEPNVEYHLPGRGVLAGTFVGPQAVEKHLKKFVQMTVTPIDVLQWDDWLVGVANVAAVARIQLQRPGHLQGFRVIFLVEVSEDDKISRVEAFFSDPDALERFFT